MSAWDIFGEIVGWSAIVLLVLGITLLAYSVSEGIKLFRDNRSLNKQDFKTTEGTSLERKTDDYGKSFFDQ